MTAGVSEFPSDVQFSASFGPSVISPKLSGYSQNVSVFVKFFTKTTKFIAIFKICDLDRIMDDKDLEILKLVQCDARLTAEALGFEIGLSPPAVQKRLKKLRETGVIEREIAVLSPTALGRGMTVIVQVMLERESRRHLDDFKRRMRSAPAVQQCYYATGEADFILVVIVQDITEYEQFTQEYFFDSSNVSKFTSSIVMDRVKVSLDII
jgi:DNA-binding Lrp family transcriptional regulator